MIAQRGSATKARNMGKVKLLRERPDRLKHSQTAKLPTMEESDDEDWLHLLDTARVIQEGDATQTDEKQQGDQCDDDEWGGQAEDTQQGDLCDEDAREGQDETTQRRGTRKMMQPKFYGREEEENKEEDPGVSKQLSPRARKRLKSQAAKTPTPRREMICNARRHENCQGRVHPPGSISTPGGRRKEKWEVRKEEHQPEGTEAVGGQVSD